MSKAETLITEHLDTWTSAIKAKSSAGRGGGKKQEFYGIKKLRELILDLAVRGLLVPQEPKEEPASQLLSKIAKEKARSKKDGTKEKGKPLPSIRPDELPYELPIGWSWARLGAISTIERGGSPRPIQSYLTDSPDGLNWIKIGDTDQGGKYIRSTGERIRPDGLKKTRMVYPGDFLLTNSMSFGRPYITLIEGCIHDGWLRISPPESLDKDYLYNLLSSPFVHHFFKASAAGAVVQNLNLEKVRLLPISLPPLAEQHRIVAKVDELMALCDQLEQQQENSVRTHSALVETLLGALTAASERGAFAEAWQRIASHFDTLFTTESSIDQLKQTILQLAVMGKLVEQKPEDEPAEKLVKRLQGNLTPEQKRQSAKPLSPLTQREIPYKIPQCWVWCRFRDVAIIASNLVNPKEYQDFTHLAPDNIEKGNGVLLPCHIVEEDKVRSSNHRFYPGQIVYSKIRPNLSKAVVVDFDGLCSADMYPINSLIDTNYLHRYMLSEPFLMQAVKSDTRVAMPKINQTELNAIGVPVPPLAEQHRIVGKVDELMSLCGRLKASLQSAQTNQLHLADTLVEAATH